MPSKKDPQYWVERRARIAAARLQETASEPAPQVTSRKTRGQVDEVPAKPKGEDAMNGLPRSNYLTSEPTPTWIVEAAEKGDAHPRVVAGPLKEQPGFATSIQNMTQQARDRILNRMAKEAKARER